MRYRLVCLLILSLSIWLTDSAWAANYQDTLWARADTANNAWPMSGIGGDKYERIDDPNTPNDADYITSGVAAQRQDWKVFDPDTTDKLIDSVEQVGRAAYVGGDAGTAELVFVRRFFDEGQWVACAYAAGYDTVEITDTYTNYSKMHTVEPCNNAALRWIYFVDATGGYLTCWGVRNHSMRTGTPIPSNRVSWSFVVIYSHSEAEAGQVIIIGALDEENYHNPRRGIPPAAWE